MNTFSAPHPKIYADFLDVLTFFTGYRQIVKLLLENGANVDCVNDEHLTPLHLAVTKGHLKVHVIIQGGLGYSIILFFDICYLSLWLHSNPKQILSEDSRGIIYLLCYTSLYC